MECHLRFRSPYLSQAELTALYEGLPGWVWSTSEDSPRWRNVRALCERYSPGHTILDVGCFTGDFLDRMPPGWIKLGIEPGHGARQIAERRNIKIIAHSVELATNCKADVITMLDVIEHFVNPLQQLSKASSLLRSGGCIVVSTGNADAISFRLLSNNYWYCSIPEHVSFLSKRWFEWAAQRLDMKVQACEYVAADAFDLHRWLRDGVRNMLFALVQRLRASGFNGSYLHHIPILGRVASWQHCPWWLTAKDHIIVALQKTY